MYSHHFGLTQDPFSIAPDPRYLFMSERHREALAHLLYGVGGPQRVAGGGFVLLTGDIGTGKTTICRCFLEQIPANCHVAYIFNPKLTVTELLQSICAEFHITHVPTKAEAPTLKNYIDALNEFLLQSHAAGQSCVLIIDEAQNLQPEVLEQLRLLTNLETNERKLLQIVLIGQPELRSMLARPELEQLAQRVIARFHLDALTESESADYIRHRMAVAGHSGALPFETRALRKIHRLTGGVPRRINLLCGRALLGAWGNGLHQVDGAVVNKAAAEVFGSLATPATTGRLRRYAVALGALGITVLVAFILWPHAQPPSPTGTGVIAKPVVAPSVEPVVSPRSSAVANASAIANAQRNPIEDLAALLPQLPTEPAAAWRALALQWKLSVLQGEPCKATAAQGLQCFTAHEVTVPQLRQLGRPGILTLQSGDKPPVFAVLVALGDDTATLQIGGHRHTVRWGALGRMWQGDFATYWRPPAGYVRGPTTPGSVQAVARLATLLAQVEGSTNAPRAPGSAPVLDAALKERVRAFQRAQGLRPDGLPGPMTFMQLESATGANEPRLQTEPR